ncbi:MAG: sulfur carrier protein ThiS [Planctomycetes bacterium]|nr:sulfur carrier protein ThiS [Planctomycetota bacterium]
MPTLKVNGTEKEYAEDEFPNTIANLIAEMEMDAKAVVAEVNGEIVTRDLFETWYLKDGMEVELVQFVGGG